MQPSTPTEAPTTRPSLGKPGEKKGWEIGTALAVVAIAFSIVAIALNLVLPGPAGSSASVSSELQSGQNETGLYSVTGGPAGVYMGDAVNFRIPLESDLPSANVSFIPNSTSYTTACPGPGEALRGQLCVYQTLNQSTTFEGIVNPYAALPGASKYGFEVYCYAGSSTYSFSYGTWTVTAP